MARLDQQISALQDRLGQLKLRQQRLETRQRAVASIRERKADLRRKILLGGVVSDRMRDDEACRLQVLGWLDAALTRDADRALLDLPLEGVVDPTAEPSAD